MRNLCCFLGAVLCFLAVAEAGAANFVLKDTITAADVAAQDEFGGRSGNATSVSSDGSTLLVTSGRGDCAAGPDCGAAYVFVRTGEGWVQQAKLTGPDSAPGDLLSRVALSGDGNMALLGASNADCAAGADCGAVYFFVRDGTAWSFQQKLTASDASASDFFGGAVGISNDGTVALVGAFQVECGALSACGAVYAFERSGGVWTETQKLSGDPAFQSYFGGVLALSGDGGTALINGDVFGGILSGRAYVFVRSGGVWSFQTKLAPLGLPLVFAFTLEVSADGNTALVYEDNFSPDPDFVYVFTRTGTMWSLETRIPVFANISNATSTVALSDDGETAVIKDQRVCSGGTCRVGHVFRRHQGQWSPVQELITPPNFVDFFNDGSVDISGDAQTVLIADPGAPCASGPSCGVAHIFGPFVILEDVPTASHLGLALLALLLAASGALVLARRRSA